MATAKKRGDKWRCLVYDYTDSAGKRHYRSFTADTKKAAELAAAQYVSQEKTNPTDLTFGNCLKMYIDQRSDVLSPATIKEYKGAEKRYFSTIKDKNIYRITQKDIQNEVNFLSRTLSPKSVRNAHGIISAVFGAYRPEFALHTVLPKKVPPKIYVPSEDEIKRLMAAIKGTRMELPVLLAAFGPMRRGEICALRAENISGNVVHVCENMVQNEDKEWIVKIPKSYAGDRFIEYPDFVADHWKNIRSGRLVDMNPMMVTHAFEHNLIQANLPHFRFHDLRHFAASIQHAIGIPDSYIMLRGGWGNDAVLKNLYRHTLADYERTMTDRINSHFTEMQPEMQPEK